MTSYTQLAREADSRHAGHEGRPEFQIRADLRAALAAEHPVVLEAAIAASREGRGKKAVVAAAASAALDLDDPVIVQALQDLTQVGSWRAAERLLSRLGFGGELLSSPQRRGLDLPASPHACDIAGWGTNWGLPCVLAAAELVLRRAPAQATRGDGWSVS